MSHAPASGQGDGDDWAIRGFDCFKDIYQKCSPRFHLHGHQHLNYGSNISRFHSIGATQIINGFGYYILDTEKSTFNETC